MDMNKANLYSVNLAMLICPRKTRSFFIWHKNKSSKRRTSKRIFSIYYL